MPVQRFAPMTKDFPTFDCDAHVTEPPLIRERAKDFHYCKHCGTPLWVSDTQWPELVHPFASAIDTELPKAPSSVHLLLRDKASWIRTADRPQ